MGTPRPDDAVGAQHAQVQVGDVHRAALAVAVARRAAQELGVHALGVAALGDEVAVAAMGAGDVVVLGEEGADAHADRLLAGVEMGDAGDLGVAHQFGHPLLELADGDHGLVHLDEVVLGDVHTCPP